MSDQPKRIDLSNIVAGVCLLAIPLLGLPKFMDYALAGINAQFDANRADWARRFEALKHDIDAGEANGRLRRAESREEMLELHRQQEAEIAVVREDLREVRQARRP